MFSKIEEKVYKALLFFCFLLMLAMISIIFTQVIARYAFHNSLTWSEEVGRYLFVWITFLGAALGVRNKSHVALDILIKKLPPLPKNIIVTFTTLAMMVFSAVLIYASMTMLAIGSRQVSAALQLQMKWVYTILPVSGFLIIFYLGKNLYEYFREKS